MKFGCCVQATAESLKMLVRCGCDCYESSLVALPRIPDETLREVRRVSDGLGLPCAAYNCMFPGDFRLLAGEAEYARIGEYLDGALAKAEILGGNFVSLGSGKARDIPAGMDRETAKERFSALVRDVIAPVMKKHGFRVAVEPLSADETSFLNNCREVMELVKMTDLPELGLLYDSYHAERGGDLLSEMKEYGSSILHVHIASVPRERKFPAESDLGSCRALFAALKGIGYTGAVDLEGFADGDFETSVKKAIGIMKRAAE